MMSLVKFWSALLPESALVVTEKRGWLTISRPIFDSYGWGKVRWPPGCRGKVDGTTPNMDCVIILPVIKWLMVYVVKVPGHALCGLCGPIVCRGV